MSTLSSGSQITLYILLALMGLFALLTFGWQVMVLRGKAMENADGSFDDWHEQKILYGMALADIILACPACILGIILIFISPQWGFYLLAMIAFWFVWANIMTTSTSLRFERPKITLIWLFTFPTGTVVGLAFIIWTIVNFEIIFAV